MRYWQKIKKCYNPSLPLVPHRKSELSPIFRYNLTCISITFCRYKRIKPMNPLKLTNFIPTLQFQKIINVRSKKRLKIGINQYFFSFASGKVGMGYISNSAFQLRSYFPQDNFCLGFIFFLCRFQSVSHRAFLKIMWKLFTKHSLCGIIYVTQCSLTIHCSLWGRKGFDGDFEVR